MRRAAKVDDNQPEIVAAFRRLGCVVFPTHQIGNGFPDIAVRCGKMLRLVEIKDGAKPKSAQKLTEKEAAFHEQFTGCVDICASLDDVERMVKQWRAAQ